MSNCKHCWHSRGQWSDTVGTHENRVCCHCGLHESLHTPHDHPNAGHGPFAPTPASSTVLWCGGANQ